MFKLKKRSSSHFEYILFDLDETLYPREAGLMEAISQRILLFMTQKVGMPADDALEKKRYYYQNHGTSLQGLIAEYNIDPLEYLKFVHDLNLQDYLRPSPPLDVMLREIPLHKVIFTNADLAHTERVLEALQVRPHFDQIIDIDALNYHCKPDPLAYRLVLDLLGVPGERCIMVDDTARNLLPAKDLGMVTILVDSESKTSAIDYVVPTIFHVGRVLKDLLFIKRR
jgi:putative hydrolase of the HAD superfamily